MPIVDGMTSTKMIRQSEQKSPNLAQSLSPRAKLNGRVPIIAVSASLLEAQRQSYIDAGFDAWILKPISFTRLSDLMGAIVDPKARKDSLYVPGEWERGGWFAMAKPIAAETEPALKPGSMAQLHYPSDETVTARSQTVLGEEQVQSPPPME
jgi:CheY-like chemotaxis protein